MSIRYKLCPQMKIYDQIGYQWLPNIMFSQNPNYRSKILNTDSYGLRFNHNTPTREFVALMIL